MIERACDGENAFDVIVVHSYSRFFREAFEQEFYLRKLAKHKVRVVSITQPVGDENEPVHAMMRKVIALFDEYQSKENAITRPAFRFDFPLGAFAGFERELGFGLDLDIRTSKVGDTMSRTTSTPQRPATRGVRSGSVYPRFPSPTATLHLDQKSSRT